MHGVRSGLLRPPRGDEKNVYNDEAETTGGGGLIGARGWFDSQPQPPRCHAGTPQLAVSSAHPSML